MNRISVLAFLLLFASCAGNQVKPVLQATELEAKAEQCAEITCDEAKVFAVDWQDQVSNLSSTKKAVRSYVRFQPKRAIACVEVYDEYLAWRIANMDRRPAGMIRAIRGETYRYRYELSQVSERRDQCLATYHKVMQTAIAADEELVFNQTRMSRARLVLDYIALLVKRNIVPELVRIAATDLTRAYARGIQEDYGAVVAKTSDNIDLCGMLKLGDSAPSHGLNKEQLKLLQCEYSSTASR